MMKKLLFALSLSFLLSSCRHGGPQNEIETLISKEAGYPLDVVLKFPNYTFVDYSDSAYSQNWRMGKLIREFIRRGWIKYVPYEKQVTRQKMEYDALYLNQYPVKYQVVVCKYKLLISDELKKYSVKGYYTTAGQYFNAGDLVYKNEEEMYKNSFTAIKVADLVYGKTLGLVQNQFPKNSLHYGSMTARYTSRICCVNPVGQVLYADNKEYLEHQSGIWKLIDTTVSVGDFVANFLPDKDGHYYFDTLESREKLSMRGYAPLNGCSLFDGSLSNHDWDMARGWKRYPN